MVPYARRPSIDFGAAAVEATWVAGYQSWVMVGLAVHLLHASRRLRLGKNCPANQRLTLETPLRLAVSAAVDVIGATIADYTTVIYPQWG